MSKGAVIHSAVSSTGVPWPGEGPRNGEDIPKGTGVVSRDSVTRRGTEICPHLFHGFASVGEKCQLQIIVFSRIW